MVWLEDHLSTYDKILVVVSHSQDFLNGPATPHTPHPTQFPQQSPHIPHPTPHTTPHTAFRASGFVQVVGCKIWGRTTRSWRSSHTPRISSTVQPLTLNPETGSECQALNPKLNPPTSHSQDVFNGVLPLLWGSHSRLRPKTFAVGLAFERSC